MVFKRSKNKGPRIIAFTGPKTCGKDTVAQVLLNQNHARTGPIHPYFARTPFAAGVKQICHDVFDWSHQDMDDPIFKETQLVKWPHIEPRWAMMDIANWMRDKYGADVWVKALDKRIRQMEAHNPYGAYIITDLRFPNEIDWLDTQNSLIIYIRRDEAEKALAKAQEEGDPKALNRSESHYAEMLERCDLVLPNDLDIHHAQHEAMNMIRARFDHWTYWRVRTQ